MAKLGEFVNPVSGSKGSITSVGSWTSTILGVMVLAVAGALGMWLYRWLSRATAGVPGLGNAMNTGATTGPATDPSGAVQIWSS